MRDAYTIIVTNARPKPRPRFTARGTVYTPQTGVEDLIAAAWRSHRYPTLDGPVGMMIVVAGRGDIDNLAKLAMDSLIGLAYNDDRQVRLLLALKLTARQVGQMGLPKRFTAVSIVPIEDPKEVSECKQEIFNALVALIGTINQLPAQPMESGHPKR